MVDERDARKLKEAVDYLNYSIHCQQEAALKHSLRLKSARLLQRGRSMAEIDYRIENALDRISAKKFKTQSYVMYKLVEDTINEVLPKVINKTIDSFTDYRTVVTFS